MIHVFFVPSISTWQTTWLRCCSAAGCTAERGLPTRDWKAKQGRQIICCSEITSRNSTYLCRITIFDNPCQSSMNGPFSISLLSFRRVSLRWDLTVMDNGYFTKAVNQKPETPETLIWNITGDGLMGQFTDLKCTDVGGIWGSIQLWGNSI